jgi:hypothetical protein
MPLIEKVIRRNDSHRCHQLQSKIHVDIEESHVTDQVEIKTFQAKDDWDCYHRCKAEEQEVIKHDKKCSSKLKVFLF